MKNLLALFCAVLVLASCDGVTGSGNIVTEKRNTGNFTGINVSNGFDVEVKMGSTTSVTIEADDNVIGYVRTSVNDGVLNLGLKNMSNTSNVHLKAYIIVPSLNMISASAGADVVVKDPVTADGKVTFRASSGASLKVKVDAPDVEGEASSGGTLTLSGTTKNESFDASSSGEVKAHDLLSENATARASSGGEIGVNISVSLDANASSGGNINYRGSGNVTKAESSGGSVDKE